MFSWFDASDAQQFGTTLAEFFIERIPAEDSGKKDKAMIKKQEVINKMLLQIEIFKVNHKLNIFKKAKLANAFKWKLLDGKYDSEFVDELTKTLLINF
ncbi:MAG TPA: hypothetical protein VK832_13610 [Burkholderiaceae bacterium]|jgi:hypothetical protein|nr:hypothetical protein [Burkholderiaceae bacterium]